MGAWAAKVMVCLGLSRIPAFAGMTDWPGSVCRDDPSS